MQVLKNIVLFGLLSWGFGLWAQDGATVELRIEKLANRKGEVLIGLFKSADNFPDFGKQDYAARVAVGKEGVVSHTFLVKPGTYVAAIIHDENKNGKLDRNFFGVPTEGYGFSKNEFAIFGMPPDFEDAAFDVEQGGSKEFVIELRY